MIFGAALETLGIGLILPILDLLTTDEMHHPLIETYFQGSNKESLIKYCLFIFAGLYIVKGIYLAGLAWVIGRYTFSCKAEIGDRLMWKYINAPYQFHLSQNSAQLIRNLTIENQQMVGSVLNPLFALATETAVIIAIILFLFFIEPFGTGVVIGCLFVLSFAFPKIVSGFSQRLGQRRQQADGFVIQRAQEALTGLKEIKVTNTTNYFFHRFKLENQKSATVSGLQYVIRQLPRFYIETAGAITLAIFIYILLLTKDNFLEIIPTISAFALAAFRILPSANRILAALNAVRYGEPVIYTLRNQLGSVVPRNTSNVTEKAVKQFEDSITVDHVSFAYPGINENALDNIFLEVHKGESVGVVGRSGSGKSTLSNIILTLLKPDVGRILVDGIQLRSTVIGDNNLFIRPSGNFPYRYCPCKYCIRAVIRTGR